MQEIENKLEYVFRDKSLLERALTHSSYANENRKRNVLHNERLEFLGDSVLGMTVAAYLYENYPDMREGNMTRFRSELVCETALAKVAEKLNLGRYMRLGRGEEAGGGRTRPSITADAVEAVIAAVYLDGGLDEASKIIHRFILEPIKNGQKVSVTDHKTELQELVQRKSGQILTYELKEESGPDHDKRFVYDALINGETVGTGVGKTKKEAEQAAAGDALSKLRR